MPPRAWPGRFRAAAFSLLLALLLLFPASALAAPFCGPGETPQFRFGFAHLKSLLGETMGQPIECEHANPENGDTLQQTSTGLSFYRKATNTPTFTDGWTHWAWTAQGLVTWTGSDIDPPGTATEPIESTPTTASIDPGAPVLSVAELAAANRGAIVRIDVSDGCGSGFIVNSEGYIVTNEHVVTTSNEISVRMDGDVVVAGTVISRDANHDIALVKIASGSYTSVNIGSSDDVSLGAALIIMGHPLCSTNVTVTTGILSSRATVDELDFIQTDATVNPGNSGGAAFDSRGALIGIPIFKFVGEAIENTNFLIPMNRVRPAIDSWIEQHRAGTLGDTTAPEATAAPSGDPVLVYERDSLFCGIAGVAWWVENVPIYEADNFILQFDVHDLDPSVGTAGMFFGGAGGDDLIYLVLTGGFFRGAGGPYDISLMEWDDTIGWGSQDRYSGLVPLAPYSVEVAVLYPSVYVTVNGQLATVFDGVTAKGRTLGMACTVFSGVASTAMTFRNVKVWAC